MKRFLILLLASASLAGCETAGPPPLIVVPPPPVSEAFRAADFAWSTTPGANRIDGVLAMRTGSVRYSCSGSTVILMPQTPWSQRRVTTLYGSPTAATVPVDVVRARTPPAPPEFNRFVRTSPCAGDRFTFGNLADGTWFLITLARPSTAGGAQVAVMRRVETRGGRPIQVVLGAS